MEDKNKKRERQKNIPKRLHDLQFWAKGFNVLAVFFPTIETKLDYYHWKVNVQVDERLKTQDLRKLGNFKKIIEIP